MIKSTRIQVDTSLLAHLECRFAAQMCPAINKALEALAKPRAWNSALNPASVTSRCLAESLSWRRKRRGCYFIPFSRLRLRHEHRPGKFTFFTFPFIGTQQWLLRSCYAASFCLEISWQFISCFLYIPGKFIPLSSGGFISQGLLILGNAPQDLGWPEFLGLFSIFEVYSPVLSIRAFTEQLRHLQIPCPGALFIWWLRPLHLCSICPSCSEPGTISWKLACDNGLLFKTLTLSMFLLPSCVWNCFRQLNILHKTIKK